MFQCPPFTGPAQTRIPSQTRLALALFVGSAYEPQQARRSHDCMKKDPSFVMRHFLWFISDQAHLEVSSGFRLSLAARRPIKLIYRPAVANSRKDRGSRFGWSLLASEGDQNLFMKPV